MNTAHDPWLARAPVVFDAAAIAEAVERIAVELTARCAGREPVLVTALLGALPFTAALLPKLAFPWRLDCARLSRYRGDTTGGELEWLLEPLTPLDGRMVVLLDDVLDDGATLTALRGHCAGQGAAEVIAAVLVRKRSPRRPPGVDAEITGLEADDGYLFGFGMDYRERYRHLPDIHRLPDGEDT